MKKTSNKNIYIEQNAKLKILRNLVFFDRCNLRTVNKNFNNIFKKYKHEKTVYGDYDKNINYGEYKNINFALNNFDKQLINVPNNVHVFNFKYKEIWRSNLKELPSELGNIYELYIGYLPNIKELPSELGNVHTLFLNNLLNIKELPSGLGNIDTLKLDDLPNLKELPSELGNVHYLKLHDLPKIKELPSELGNIHTLSLENLPNIKELPSELGNVHTLDLWNLQKIKELPSEFKNIEDLWNYDSIPYKQ